MLKNHTALYLLLIVFVQSVAQNTLNLDPTGTSRFSVTDKAWPLNVGEADVCMWNDDKLSAFTLTIDDNNEQDIPFWKTMLSTYGFNFTWFVITEADAQYNVQNWNLYNDLAELGSQINGHDDRNWYDNPGAGETNPTDAEYLAGLQATQAKVNTEVTSGENSCLTYAYPFGEGNDTEARKVFISIRDVVGVLNKVDLVDYLHVNSISSSAIYGDDTSRDKYILPLMNTTSALYGTNYYRGWGSTHFHSIGDAANEIKVEEFIQYLANKSDLWVAGFTEVAQYSQSFATHSLTVDNVTAAEIKFTLTDDMLNSAFYFPLSIKIRIDNSWASVSATQNGKSVDSKIITNGGNKYALVKAVPDEGQVTVMGVVDADPPVIVPVGNKSMLAGARLQVDFSASTVGGDAISFTASNLPIFGVLTDHGDNTGKIVFTPGISTAGDYQDITVVADNGRSSVSELFNLTVSPDAGGAPTTSYNINPTADGIISDVADLAEGGTNPWLAGNGIDGTTVLKVGASASTGASINTNAIIPFQLPVRPPGKLVVAANLKVNIAYLRHWIDADIDLYGLPYNSLSTISPSDFYDLGYADPTGTVAGIQRAFFVRDTEGSEPLGTEILTDREVNSDDNGDDALAAYINAQYDAGAIAGDYVFLRLTINSASGTLAGAHYYGISDESTTKAPVLTIEIENVLSVENHEISSLKLYPNPLTDGRLKVSLDGFSNDTRLEIYSLHGQLVHSVKIKASSMNNFETQLNLTPGLYIVKLQDGERGRTQKLIVQ